MQSRKYACETTEQEVAILTLLEKRAPAIIAPRVLGYNTDPEKLKIGSPFILLSKLEGCNLSQLAQFKVWDQFKIVCHHSMSSQMTCSHYRGQSKFLPGLAHALADLFSIEIPSQIGPIVGVTEDGIPTVGKFRDENIFRRSDCDIDSASGYFEWRISATIWEKKDNSPVDVEALLIRLNTLAQRLIGHIDPSLLRVCLVHLDPHDRNAMVKDSEFSGLVDWQVRPGISSRLAYHSRRFSIGRRWHSLRSWQLSTRPTFVTMVCVKTGTQLSINSVT